MPVPILGALAGIALPVGLFLIARFLRRQRRQQLAALPDAEGVVVFEGSKAESRQAMHALADAGVMAWTETLEADRIRVCVDPEQAAEVEALLHLQQRLKDAKKS